MTRRKPKKPKRRPKSRPKRKSYRCCGRVFKTASALASHRRVRAPRAEPPQLPRGWRGLLRGPKKVRGPKRVRVAAPRRCAVCGEATDHDGDGHPYEDWDEGEERRVVVRPGSRRFQIRPTFEPLRPTGELT